MTTFVDTSRWPESWSRAYSNRYSVGYTDRMPRATQAAKRRRVTARGKLRLSRRGRKYSGRKTGRTYGRNRTIVAAPLYKRQVTDTKVWAELPMDAGPTNSMLMVPFSYVTMYQGISSGQMTGDKIFSKNVSMTLRIKFPTVRIATTLNTPLLRFVHGFLKVDYSKNVTPVTGDAARDVPYGIVQNETTDAIQLFVGSMLDQALIKAGGEFNPEGSYPSSQVKVIRDHKVPFTPDAVNEPVDGVTNMYTSPQSITMNWPIKKDIYCQDCRLDAASLVPGFKRPMNRPGQWTPFVLISWLNSLAFTGDRDYWGPSINISESHFYLNK